MPAEPTVFVVDDDPSVRASLALLLGAGGHTVECFETASAFLDRYGSTEPGCAIVDLRLPGIDGLELQDRLQARGAVLPIVFLTGYGDVSTAVRALKHGAVDFLEKPFDADRLLALVDEALARDVAQRAERDRREDAARRVGTLTPREREIMRLIAQGRANKVVAAELSISDRTVELHRSRIMHKTRTRSVAELVRILQILDG